MVNCQWPDRPYMGEAGKWATMLDGLFSGDTLFFSVPAVAGTIFFVLRLALSFTGLGDFDGDADASGIDVIKPGRSHAPE